MRRWMRLGMAAITIVVLAGAATGAYALIGGGNSVDETPLPGFRLVRPALAQAGGAFPDPQAGLSAYVKVDPGPVDFDTLIRNHFTQLRFHGDNYIVGTIPVPQTFIGTPISVNVHVYADTEGWRLVYLTQDKLAAEMFRWTDWNPGEGEISPDPVRTVFAWALEEIAKDLGEAAAAGLGPDQLGWYDWANPEATHLLAGVRVLTEQLYMGLPAEGIGLTIFGKPSFSFNSTGSQLVLTRQGEPGKTISSFVLFTVGELDLVGGDAVYTFAVVLGGPETRLGVVAVYQEAP